MLFIVKNEVIATFIPQIHLITETEEILDQMKRANAIQHATEDMINGCLDVDGFFDLCEMQLGTKKMDQYIDELEAHFYYGFGVGEWME